MSEGGMLSNLAVDTDTLRQGAAQRPWKLCAVRPPCRSAPVTFTLERMGKPSSAPLQNGSKPTRTRFAWALPALFAAVACCYAQTRPYVECGAVQCASVPTSASDIRLHLPGAEYVAPARYFNVEGALFYWPSRTPGYMGGTWPEKGRPFYDVAIQIFLRASPARTPIQSGPQRLEELRKAGKVLSRRRVGDKLDIWETQEGPIRATWYVALQVFDADGAPYTASCHYRAGGGRCLGGFSWQPGVSSSFRFDLRHGVDWADIAAEIDNMMRSVRKIER